MLKILVLCSIFVGVSVGSLDSTETSGKITNTKSHKYVKVPNINGKFERVDLNSVEIESRFNATTDVKFLFYTRANQNNSKVITTDPNTLKDANFRDINTRILIHGWNNNGGSNFNRIIRTALLSAVDVNIIIVDWGAGAQSINYISARNRVMDIGPYVGKYIDFLINSKFLSSYDKINIIGHSLGAHVAGIAGKNTTKKVAVIFGLDPAGPLFDVKKPNERLDKYDADSTLVLHTSGGTAGFYKPITKVDIYANGGSKQPGCGLDITGSCAHTRSYEYYAEAVKSESFIAKQCISFQEARRNSCAGSSITFVGETDAINFAGIYNLKTKSAPPYAMG